MMVDLRNVMSTIFTKAQEWEVLPDTLANPTRRVKLGRRWVVRPEQILTLPPPESGQILCYKKRTLHVLTTPGRKAP